MPKDCIQLCGDSRSGSEYSDLQKNIMTTKKTNQLEGQTLEMIVTFLVETYGWEELAERIRINCFCSDPSIKSSLTFLRRTPWARKKVENLYILTKR